MGKLLFADVRGARGMEVQHVSEIVADIIAQEGRSLQDMGVVAGRKDGNVLLNDAVLRELAKQEDHPRHSGISPLLQPARESALPSACSLEKSQGWPLNGSVALCLLYHQKYSARAGETCSCRVLSPLTNDLRSALISRKYQIVV